MNVDTEYDVLSIRRRGQHSRLGVRIPNLTNQVLPNRDGISQTIGDGGLQDSTK